MKYFKLIILYSFLISCEEIEPAFLQTNFLGTESNGVFYEKLYPDRYDGIPEENREILKTENFENNNLNWITGEDAYFSAKINNNQYEIETKDNPFAFYTNFKSFDEYQNYEIEMIVSQYKSTYWGNTAMCGLILGHQSNPDKCLYFVIEAGSKYYAGHYDQGWNNWHGKETSDVIESEGYNKLSVRKYNNTFYFFANEILLKEYDIKSFYGNNMGIILNAQNKAIIESFKISYIN